MNKNFDEVLSKMDDEGTILDGGLNENPDQETQEDPDQTEPNTEDQQDPNEQQDDEQEDPQQDPEQQDEDEDEDDESDQEGNDDGKGKGDNNVIRTLRANVKTYKKENETYKKESETYRTMLETVARKQGITVEQLQEQIQKDELEAEAKTKSMSPEQLAEFKRLEREVQELRQENMRKEFNSRVSSFQQKHNLKEDEVVEFLQTAREQGFDVLNSNINFDNLYYAINREKVEAQIREEERQKVLKDIEKQREDSPARTKRNGKSDGGKKGINDLYNDIANLNNL